MLARPWPASAGRPSFGLEGMPVSGFGGLGWVLPPLSNSWIIIIIWLYVALHRTPNVDCYWVGAVPKVEGSGLAFRGSRV